MVEEKEKVEEKITELSKLEKFEKEIKKIFEFLYYLLFSTFKYLIYFSIWFLSLLIIYLFLIDIEKGGEFLINCFIAGLGLFKLLILVLIFFILVFVYIKYLLKKKIERLKKNDEEN